MFTFISDFCLIFSSFLFVTHLALVGQPQKITVPFRFGRLVRVGPGPDSEGVVGGFRIFKKRRERFRGGGGLRTLAIAFGASVSCIEIMVRVASFWGRGNRQPRAARRGAPSIVGGVDCETPGFGTGGASVVVLGVFSGQGRGRGGRERRATRVVAGFEKDGELFCDSYEIGG